MTASDGSTGNPFGNPSAESGVGFSDAALLAASVIGFLILASTVSSTVVTHFIPFKQVEKEKVAGGNGDEEQLEHADTSALGRSQSAPILKEERRALINEESSDAELEIRSDAKGSNDEDILSLKEFQRAAKAKEKLIRAAKAAERDVLSVLEDERCEQEKQAQDVAQRQKREEEREDARKQEAARLVEKKQKEELEKAEVEASKVFLSSPHRTQSVQEWIEEMKETRPVLMTEMATSFALPAEKVAQRIQELIKDGRVAGVMEGNGRFIFIAEDELHSIAESLIERSSLSLTDVATACNEELGGVQGF